jgi:hypothetical protein
MLIRNVTAAAVVECAPRCLTKKHSSWFDTKLSNAGRGNKRLICCRLTLTEIRCWSSLLTALHRPRSALEERAITSSDRDMRHVVSSLCTSKDYLRLLTALSTSATRRSECCKEDEIVGKFLCGERRRIFSPWSADMVTLRLCCNHA